MFEKLVWFASWYPSYLGLQFINANLFSERRYKYFQQRRSLTAIHVFLQSQTWIYEDVVIKLVQQVCFFYPLWILLQIFGKYTNDQNVFRLINRIDWLKLYTVEKNRETAADNHDECICN